ncbi:MAG: glycosyltransferase [Holosporales bacterium]
MRVSLIINTYNRMHTLPTTLRSLHHLRYPDLEVIVVDGPSTDGTWEYLEKNWADKVKLYRCDEANLSVSRNIGVQHASGDIVCFTDDDGVPEPDWIDQLVPAYLDNPKVAAVGGWVRNHTGVAYQTKCIVSRRDSSSENMIEDPAIIGDAKPHSDAFPALIGVNSSFRKSALMEVGGFDEVYAYFLDETDVIARLVDAGYLIKIIPEAEVHHKYAPSHIRQENGAPKAWRQIATSLSYYIFQNAVRQPKVPWAMERMVHYGTGLIRHTRRCVAEKLIDESRFDHLMEEIREGIFKGVSHAFACPGRRLMGPPKPTEWKPFPRPLEAAKRLRIAFLTPLYPPRPLGGVAVFMHHLARQLAQEGHEITVITQVDSGCPHTVDYEEGIWVHRLPYHEDHSCEMSDEEDHIGEMSESLPDMPKSLKRMAVQVLTELNRVNHRRCIDYVVGTIWDLDLAAVIAAGTYKTVMYLGTSYQLMLETKPEWIKNINYLNNHVQKMIRAETWALGKVDRIFASTNAIVEDIETAYATRIQRKKTSIFPFGLPDKRALTSQSAKIKDTVEVLFVGRFEHRKGIDLLLEVLPDLLDEYPNLHVTCMGDKNLPSPMGPTYEALFLKQHGNSPWLNRVHFPGHVEDSLLEQAYANCDIFVAPSRYESFGLIYIEAMRFGKPCVGSDSGGIPEVIEDGETGILVPPSDSSALKQALRQLIQNKDLRDRMGRSAKKNFQEKYTLTKFSQRFLGALRGGGDIHG